MTYYENGYYTILLFQDIDPVGLTEANGMLGDLLIREDRLTQKGRESLKKIQQLLTIKAPRSSIQYIPRSRLGSGDSDVTSGGSTYGSPNTRRVSFVSCSNLDIVVQTSASISYFISPLWYNSEALQLLLLNIGSVLDLCPCYSDFICCFIPIIS